MSQQCMSLMCKSFFLINPYALLFFLYNHEFVVWVCRITSTYFHACSAVTFRCRFMSLEIETVMMSLNEEKMSNYYVTLLTLCMHTFIWICIKFPHHHPLWRFLNKKIHFPISWLCGSLMEGLRCNLCIAGMNLNRWWQFQKIHKTYLNSNAFSCTKCILHYTPFL